MKISWETVAALAVFVVGCVTALVFTPVGTIEAIGSLPWEALAAAVAAILGAIGAALGRAMLRSEKAK